MVLVDVDRKSYTPSDNSTKGGCPVLYAVLRCREGKPTTTGGRIMAFICIADSRLKDVVGAYCNSFSHILGRRFFHADLG